MSGSKASKPQVQYQGLEKDADIPQPSLQSQILGPRGKYIALCVGLTFSSVIGLLVVLSLSGGKSQDKLKSFAVKKEPCASEPCLNGGQCTQEKNMYMCACIALHVGRNCEVITEMCKSKPCINSGTCENIFNAITKVYDFRCKCKEPFEGKTCSDVPDLCKSKPCINSGTCVHIHLVSSNVYDFKCLCIFPYGGRTCSDIRDLCKSNPCTGRGSSSCKTVNYTVVNRIDFKCYCRTGYVGQICSEYDYCSSKKDPCSKRGTCTFSKCICRLGFKGRDCSAFDFCGIYTPCKNGATCEQIATNYKCHCSYGTSWYDADCPAVREMSICGTTTCHIHKGRCKHKILLSSENRHIYKCHCQQGYSGRLCEVVTSCNNGTRRPYKALGYGYNGTMRTTASGITCQRWDRQTPNRHKFGSNTNYVENYCRNDKTSWAGADEHPWCYPDRKGGGRIEYCYLPCEECNTENSRNYTGTQTRTEGDITCQHWASNYPHKKMLATTVIANFPDKSFAEMANFCRNPYFHIVSPRPWCYTTDPNVKWEYCEVCYGPL